MATEVCALQKERRHAPEKHSPGEKEREEPEAPSSLLGFKVGNFRTSFQKEKSKHLEELS